MAQAAPLAAARKPARKDKAGAAKVPTGVQRKLSVGGSSDHFEREADNVARRVVQGGSAGMIPPTITPIGAQCKKLTTPPAKEEEAKPAVKAQRKPASPAKAPKGEEKKGAGKVQRKAAGPAAGKPAQEEKKPAKGVAPKAQRKAAPTGKKETRRDEPSPAKNVAKRGQRKEGGGAPAAGGVGMGGGAAPASVESSIGRMQSVGAPGLDNSTRSFMEGRFGRDFSGVRVHRSNDAAAAAGSLNAKAFTVGNDVFFNRGQYQPHSAAGRELIAHELTHTVQQGANPPRAARRVQRLPDDPAPATTGTGSSVFPIPSMPGATIEIPASPAAAGTINVPQLKLPFVAGALKGAQGGTAAPAFAAGRSFPVEGQPFDLRAPKPHRDPESVPAQVWTDQARTAGGFTDAMRNRLQEMLTSAPNAFAFQEGSQQVYYMQLRRGRGSASQVLIGTLTELVSSDPLLRPQWREDGIVPQASNERFDADHFLEMQIGGADQLSNMWLLKASYNRSVGSVLARNIRTDVEGILRQARTIPTIPQDRKDRIPASYEAAETTWNIHFNQVARGTNYSTETPYFWTRGQVARGDHLSALKFLTEPELIQAGVRARPGTTPTRVRIFPSPQGGWMKELRLRPDGTVVIPTDKELFKGIEINSATYNGGEDVAAEGTDLMTLDVTVFKKKRGGDELIEQRRGTVNVKRSPRLGIAGYLSRESIRAAAATTRFTALSPLSFNDMGVSADGQLTGVGTVGSTKLILPGLNVPLMLYGDEIRMDFPIPSANLSLGPFSITQTSLGLGVGPTGFFVQGYAGFEISGLGTGGVTATAGEGGVTIAGDFNLITDFFNPASVGVTYDFLNDTLTARATLGIDRGKIPGVDSATVNVTISRDAVDVAGTISLGGPLTGSVIQVGYSRETGLTIGGTFPLPVANIPGIQNATLTVGAVRDATTGAWSFSGQGTANLALPGVTGTITIGYRDGVVTFTTAATVQKGPATGTLNFTATNAAIDEEGHPIEGEAGNTITAWGRGSVSIQFGSIITGTAGIEYTQDHRVILSGSIALPPTYDVFARREYNRELLHVEPPEFPIWGVSVAGIGVGIFAFVDARVNFNAYVGPGQIRDASISAEMDLDRPEDATIHGHGQFFVPAYAGLSLDVGGGLRARAAVAYVQGRVGLLGELGIAADASATIDFDWNRSAGLSLETNFEANVRPKFRLSATASVTVGVDLLVTDVSHTFGPWARVLGEFGPDMELGVSFPVRWSEANGLDLSLDNITVRQPSLDAGALMDSVFDRLVD